MGRLSAPLESHMYKPELHFGGGGMRRPDMPSTIERSCERLSVTPATSQVMLIQQRPAPAVASEPALRRQ